MRNHTLNINGGLLVKGAVFRMSVPYTAAPALAHCLQPVTHPTHTPPSTLPHAPRPDRLLWARSTNSHNSQGQATCHPLSTSYPQAPRPGRLVHRPRRLHAASPSDLPPAAAGPVAGRRIRAVHAAGQHAHAGQHARLLRAGPIHGGRCHKQLRSFALAFHSQTRRNVGDATLSLPYSIWQTLQTVLMAYCRGAVVDPSLAYTPSSVLRKVAWAYAY